MGKSSKTKQPEEPSLSSFLLGKVDNKDSALESIFANSKGASTAFAPQTPAQKDKAEKQRRQRSLAPEPPTPKASASTALAPSPPLDSDDDDESAPDSDDDAEEVDAEKDGEGVANDEELSELDSDESLGLSDDEDEGIEEAYAARKVAERLKALAAGGKEGKDKKRKAEDEVDGEESDEEEEVASGAEDEEEESELEIEKLMADTVLPKAIYKEVPLTTKEANKVKAKKAKADSNETPEERDARTVFIGNVPAECSTSRPLKKALIRHMLQSPALLELLPAGCPPLKADSIRFRSLAFASTVFGRKANAADATAEPGATPTEPGGRGRKRAREWRNEEDTDARGVRGGFRQKEAAPEAVSEADKRKGALTDGQKRRVAFIRGELNEHKKACNAYLVLEGLPKSFTALSDKDVLDLVVRAADGSVFEGFHIRADHVRPRSGAALLAAAQKTARPNENLIAPPTGAATFNVPATEARKTLFVGGLDFAETEEAVRKATEEVLVREKGAPEAAGFKSWVEGVRLIRDASTGLGKGFGYVLLRNPECVDELLVLPPGRNLKVSKRKVRLERCKTGVAAARAKAAAATRDAKAAAQASSSKTPAATSVSRAAGSSFAPRDPSLPARAPQGIRALPSASASEHQEKLAKALANLPAEERRKIKAVDPERLMRRAEKKKNKVLGERFERKQANQKKKYGVEEVLGRESRAHERARKEKKRVAKGNKTGKRAKKSDLV